MWSKLEVFSVIILSVTCQIIDVPQNNVPIVTINQGVVKGLKATDGEYFEFHGIPYADSTSGTNRFKAPNAPPEFKDVFVADRKNIKCVRSLGIGYEGTEDCLVANVFTPSLLPKASLPVMVWIKGKEFDQVYENDLSFRNFMEKDVVIVSLNFRESILGFLCLGTETAPGNAGLKDIIAGLKWIQANIAQFGGDPESITLFGHGSGAAAVDLVSLSPMANGIVQKVISQSGTASAPWALSRNNIKYALQVAQALGHEVDNVEELAEIYKKTSVAALMAVINELDLTDNSLAFAPCIEKDTLDDIEPFMTQTPEQAITKGEVPQIPFMTGFVDYEGTIRAEEALEEDWLEKMKTSFTDFLQPDLEFENEEEELLLADEIKSYYFDNNNIDIEDYIQYHGDTMILVSSLREVQTRACFTNQAIFLYQFSYKGALGEPFVGPLEVTSAAHSEELAYIFYDNPENINVKDLTISDILLERWTNFAKTGNPTSHSSQMEWRPYTCKDAYYLRIIDDNDDDGAILDVELKDPHKEKMDFWNQIYEEHFLDARSFWDLNDETEGGGDGETEEIDTEEPPSTTESPSETDPGETDPGETDPGETDPGETDSASTATTSTITIMLGFGLLSLFQNIVHLS